MGPDAGGHVSGLGGACAPPPFSPNGLLGGTFPEELGGNATPLLPNMGTHLGTFQCPSTAPSHGWAGPPSLLAPWWQGLLSFIPIPQLQQTMITKGNNGNITLFRINNTTDMT